MEKASAALDFERAAIYRDRLAALSAIQSHQGINPRGVEEADVFAVHQQGGFSCVEVFFFRTGQNWGNRAYFPKADRSLAPGEVLSAFLAQFYDDKPPPRLILISHEIEDRALLAEALCTKSGHKVEVSVPQRGEKKDLVEHALANAREALGPQARRDVVAAEAARCARGDFRAAARAAPHRGLRQQPHPGHERGRRHDRRRRRRAFARANTASSTSARPTLTPGDDFAMMREVLERRFKRLLAEAPRVQAVDASSPPRQGEGELMRLSPDIEELAGSPERVARGSRHGPTSS